MNSAASSMLPADLSGQACETCDVRLHVIYEDRESGLRAKQVVDRLEADLNGEAELCASWCRFDLLNAPHLREALERAAAATDILLVSAHGQEELPEGVTLLVDTWLDRRFGAPPALVVLLDNKRPNQRLEQLARKHGADFFTCSAFPPPPDELSFEEIRYRAETITSYSSTNHWEWFPRRNWGIND